jgi:RimJ/RimL family protein N-acetyltransferase
MNFRVDDVLLRRPEPRDAEALYAQKNDPDVANLLGGFSRGYSHADILAWIERHRSAPDEALWVIADEADRCLGHVGLYKIDGRVRSAEFAIMLGDKPSWGRGIGKRVTRFALEYGFRVLNLHRIELTVLATNERARKLYERLGFRTEGVLRHAQFKAGSYVDVVVMGLLEHEFE